MLVGLFGGSRHLVNGHHQLRHGRLHLLAVHVFQFEQILLLFRRPNEVDLIQGLRLLEVRSVLNDSIDTLSVLCQQLTDAALLLAKLQLGNLHSVQFKIVCLVFLLAQGYGGDRGLNAITLLLETTLRRLLIHLRRRIWRGLWPLSFGRSDMTRGFHGRHRVISVIGGLSRM